MFVGASSMKKRMLQLGKLVGLILVFLNAALAQDIPLYQLVFQDYSYRAHVEGTGSTKPAVKADLLVQYEQNGFNGQDNNFQYPGTKYEPPNDGGKKKNGSNISKAIAIGVIGAIAIAAIHNAMSKEPQTDEPDQGEHEFENQLKENGPAFSHLYNMSAFMMIGFVKGGWPLVIDFEQQQPGYVELMVRTKTSDTFRYRLDSGGTGHRHIVLPLPPMLGNEPVPAKIAITATTGKNSNRSLAGFELLGLGAGPRAVGSVAIDKVAFAADKIQSSLGQTAAYRFYAHSNFENTSVDFMKLLDNDEHDGERHDLVNQHNLDGGITANRWFGIEEQLEWDGRNLENQPSVGPHKLKVRVWHTEGDWVSAWSNSAVSVLE